MTAPLAVLSTEVVQCTLCPRLRRHCREIAGIKRRAYRDWTYWGRPVPAFGDPDARLLILGLAPGAHGANRTGRMFTGDRSGEFLFRALHQTGFASQAESTHTADGLRLIDAYITASVRCAPPDNKPSRQEVECCRPFLIREMELLPKVRVVVALGRLAFENYLRIVRQSDRLEGIPKPFGHNVVHSLGNSLPGLISSYHPSQQNTSTGKLTAAMLKDVFERARQLVAELPSSGGGSAQG